jgi:chromosome partitioning protein
MSRSGDNGSHMQTIAVIARKGGSGKSTIATHLALGWALRGQTALLVDTDPLRSSLDALEGRRAAGPRALATTPAKLFAAHGLATRTGVDAMVIDTPAGDEDGVTDAIRVADFSLVVVRPTFLDLVVTASTLEAVRRLGGAARVILNQAPAPRDGAETPAVRKAIAALEMMRAEVAPIILRARIAYQKAVERGLSVEEGADAAAAQETALLWN